MTNQWICPKGIHVGCCTCSATPEITLNNSHWHEVLDRIHILIQMLDMSLSTHPTIMQTPTLAALVDTIDEKLGDLYVEIGQHFNLKEQ